MSVRMYLNCLKMRKILRFSLIQACQNSLNKIGKMRSFIIDLMIFMSYSLVNSVKLYYYKLIIYILITRSLCCQIEF